MEIGYKICNENPSHSSETIVYYISLVIFVIALLVSIFIWLWIYLNSNYYSTKEKKFYTSYNKNVSTTYTFSYEEKEYIAHNNCVPFLLKSISISIVVFSLNALLYIILLMGQGFVYRNDLFRCIPWVRYVIYSLSCSLLAYEIANYQKFVKYLDYLFIFLITSTLLTGVFIVLSVNSEINRYIWFGIGFIFYIPALLILFFFSDPCHKFTYNGQYFLPIFVVVFWSIYPVAFILGPTMLNIISLNFESIMYLVSDFFTKIFFSFFISYKYI